MREVLEILDAGTGREDEAKRGKQRAQRGLPRASWRRQRWSRPSQPGVKVDLGETVQFSPLPPPLPQSTE